jgi:hypothetical protein
MSPNSNKPASSSPRNGPANRQSSGASGAQKFLDLPEEQEGEDFGDMFKGLGLRKSMTFDDFSTSLPPPAVLKKVGYWFQVLVYC